LKAAAEIASLRQQLTECQAKNAKLAERVVGVGEIAINSVSRQSRAECLQKLEMAEAVIAGDGSLITGLKDDLAELEAKPSLIVIDTLTRLLTGLDENSAKDATLITNFMESLARHYECFVLAIHHTGKDQSKGARGSSAFISNVDTAFSVKLKQGGTELRVRKQKDADVTDEISYFAVKEVASSIVLERTASLADVTSEKNSSSRYSWAQVDEVVQVLSGLGGETSDGVLFEEIAGKHGGLDRDVVRKQLAKNDALTFLRPEKGKWKIPKREFDL
jgi:hypothetical protein